MSPITYRLGLGCMGFGSSRWRSWVLDETEALPQLDAAIDAGVTFFDTANAYSGGESERILGRFIRRRGLRDRVIIATKLFYDTPDRLGLTGLGRENVVGSAEESLKRLETDRIDLLQVHRWDPAVPIEETLEACDTLIRDGKVGAIGASNLTAANLAEAQDAAARIGVAGFSTVQPHYNLLYREDENDLIPMCRAHGIAVLPWSPLARGRLARSRGAVATERARQDDVADTLYAEADDAVVATLHDVAADRGVPAATVALAWLMAKDTRPIVGATRASHIADAVRAADLILDGTEVARLEAPYRARSKVELPYTARNQTPTAALSGATT